MMNCPYCQQETSLFQSNPSTYYCVYCGGSFCDVMWLVDSAGRIMQTTMYFYMGTEKIDPLAFFINHQQGISKVYLRNSAKETVFMLSSIPDWTPKTVAQQVKKLMPFL